MSVIVPEKINKYHLISLGMIGRVCIDVSFRHKQEKESLFVIFVVLHPSQQQ